MASRDVRLAQHPTDGSASTVINLATDAPPNTGVFWTANHDARLMENIPVPIDWAMGLVVLYNMRTKDGREFLKDIFKKYMDSVTSICGHLAQAGAANIVTAYGHQVLIANILEHNYIMQAAGAGGFATGLNIVVGSEVATGILSTFLGGKTFDVPSTLILAGVGQPEYKESGVSPELLRAVRGIGESGKKEKESVNISKAVQTAATVIK